MIIIFNDIHVWLFLSFSLILFSNLFHVAYVCTLENRFLDNRHCSVSCLLNICYLWFRKNSTMELSRIRRHEFGTDGRTPGKNLNEFCIYVCYLWKSLREGSIEWDRIFTKNSTVILKSIRAYILICLFTQKERWFYFSFFSFM